MDDAKTFVEIITALVGDLINAEGRGNKATLVQMAQKKAIDKLMETAKSDDAESEQASA